MMRMLALVLVCVATAGSLPAQLVAGVVTPNPALPGQSVSLTITNGTGATIVLPSSCTYSSVHSGTPNGPMVDAPFCLTVLTNVQPCATRSQNWTPPAGTPSGTYWFRVRWWDQNFTAINTDWFCFEIQAASDPTLLASTQARVGQDLVMAINAPAYAGGAYIAAASLTTNTGFSAGAGLNACLDLDAVFALSFPVPDPTLFANFQGTLSNAGTVANITVHVPNIPALACLPLHVQAAVLPVNPGQAADLTNALNFAILP